MVESSIHDLNRLILNEEAMIETYGRLVPDVKDPSLKDRFRAIQENHFNQMMVYSDRVLELGGDPKFDIGIRGIKDDMGHNSSTSRDTTDLETAKVALEAERDDAVKLGTFDFSEIDTKSHELHQKALEIEHENIKSLEEYISWSEVPQ